MTRIGGAPPPKKGDAIDGPRKEEGSAQTPAPESPAPKSTSSKVMDSFQRVAPQLSERLGAMAGKKAMPSIQFTSEHLAQVAMAFAGLLRKKPGASRRERARMFARAFLKSRKFGAIFDEADEEELEEIYDLIGDQLEGSPVLAQLVDDVTEGARKIPLG